MQNAKPNNVNQNQDFYVPLSKSKNEIIFFFFLNENQKMTWNRRETQEANEPYTDKKSDRAIYT